MTAANWVTVGIFLVGMAMSGVVAYYAFVRDIERRVTIVEQKCASNTAVIDRLSELNARLDKIAADNETFWRILGPPLADIIHSPEARDRDELVDQLTNGHIDIDGAHQLIYLLTEAIGSDRWSGDKRLAGALLLARVRTKLADLEAERAISRKERGCSTS